MIRYSSKGILDTMNKILLTFLALFALNGTVTALEVNITPAVGEFQVRHGNKTITIIRNQETDALLDHNYAYTSRPCPPFCAQPMQAAKKVETIGEAELVEFMQNHLADGSGLLIDARTPDWFERGTIPGSVNIPYTQLNLQQGANDITLEDALSPLGVTEKDGIRNFSQAKILALWCNGPWCGQSPAAIRGLLSIGYPVKKLLYYRGGMQLWRIFGLPIVRPDGTVIED
jgi:rhodanese-related sulfurtransferase